MFEGAYREGKKNGKGVITFQNGDIFEGEWKNDMLVGEGTFKYPNGEEFTGHWSRVKLNQMDA